tara:strand:- start:138 stop:776 length:639 start_codon:yes stop_codon:yes gene_type:complete
MSLNHIIQNSVPDDEALSVKFKDVEITGDVYTNGKLYQNYFNQMNDRLTPGNVTGFQQMLFNSGAFGTTLLPANTLKIGSILKLSIKGKIRNQISATTGSFNFRFNIGQYVAELAFPKVPGDSTEPNYPFTLTFEVHVKTATELDAYMHYNNFPVLIGRLSSDLMAYQSTTQDPILFDFGVANNVEALVEINGLNSSDAWVRTEYATIEVLH